MHGHDCLPRNRTKQSWHDNVGGIIGLRLDHDGDKINNEWFSVPDGAPNMHIGKKTRNKPEWDETGGLRCLDGWEMFVQEKDQSGHYYLRTQRGNFNKQDGPGHTRPYLSLKNNMVFTTTNKDNALKFKKTEINANKAIFSIIA